MLPSACLQKRRVWETFSWTVRPGRGGVSRVKVNHDYDHVLCVVVGLVLGCVCFSSRVSHVLVCLFP